LLAVEANGNNVPPAVGVVMAADPNQVPVDRRWARERLLASGSGVHPTDIGWAASRFIVAPEQHL
jgi:hypothetical protein